MNNPKTNKPNPTFKDTVTGFPKYALEIIADIFLGIVLGLSVNFFVDYLGKKFGLKFYAKLIIQIILIILVLYVMKVDSKYLYESWKGETSYGIIFTSIFLAVQKNLMHFLEYIFTKGEKQFNIAEDKFVGAII